MNWIAFGIIAYASLLVQSAIAPRLEFLGARPDVLLVVATFLGLYARRAEAIAAAWLMGLAADLLTIEQFGLLATSYALITLGIAVFREYLFRYRATTQFAVTFICGLLLCVLWIAYARFTYSSADGVPFHVYQAVLGSLYSALLALILHRLLLRSSRFIGLPRPRYGFSGV